jgi:hypothetical protein
MIEKHSKDSYVQPFTTEEHLNTIWYAAIDMPE